MAKNSTAQRRQPTAVMPAKAGIHVPKNPSLVIASEARQSRLINQPEALSRTILAYWQGRMPLWSAFWVYGMFFGTLLGLVMTPISQVIINQFKLALMVDSTAVWLLYGYLLMVMFGFWWSYYTWHVVGVWRCAANTPQGVPTLWGWAARLFVLLVTLTYWPAFFVVIYLGF